MRRWLALLLALLPLAPPVAAAPQAIERVTSPGGVVAWLIRQPEVPVIGLRFSIEGGARAEPADKPGTARLMADLLDEGAGPLDAQAFQLRLEELAVELNFSAGRDELSGGLRTLARNREDAFRLLGQALAEPRFEEGAIARAKRQIHNELLRQQEDPQSIARRAWAEAVFAGEAYGRPADGTPQSLAALSRDDIVAYHRQRVARDRLAVGVAGDITAAELAPLLDLAFARLPATSAPLADDEQQPRLADKVQVVRRAVPQSAIVFGLPGVKRDDPDWYIAFVLNHILGGGGLTSRLAEAVREKRGLAYSVSSYLVPLDRAGLLMGSAGTVNARVPETLTTIRAELRRLAQDGPSEQELADAKTFLNGSFALQLVGSGRLAELLVTLQRRNLGADHLLRRPQLIDAVSAADIARVADRLLRLDRLYVVVVGDPPGV
ncbi:MAG: insulinase family protein [Alphaproteobacteria bacterium]|nr:insulinase family protein [Alphaproteobacteria bacterium]